jgi:hypothetical protein
LRELVHLGREVLVQRRQVHRILLPQLRREQFSVPSADRKMLKKKSESKWAQKKKERTLACWASRRLSLL